MSPAVAERLLLDWGALGITGGPDGGRLTLEQRLHSVWEGLRADGAAECPVCGGELRRGVATATCSSCHSRIS